MELYNIQGWGRKYFSINSKGNVAVTPREGYASVDLREVMDELQVRDITSPVLLRFPDILDNRIEKISNCFAVASKQYNYEGQNYIIYTDHSFDEDGNTKVYASTFDPDAPVTHLEPIRSDAEWKMIEAILEELQAEVFADCYD